MLFAVDPGVTTGYVILWDSGVLAGYQLSQEDFAPALYRQLVNSEVYDNFTVVVEDFVGAGRRDANMVLTMQLLGYVRFLCLARQVRCVVQPPQYRKPWLHDAEQEFPGHAQRHMKDAYAHMLAFLHLEKSRSKYEG